MYVNRMSGGPGEDRHNCWIAQFGGSILNGGFGMQMESVSVCVKLVRG